MSTLKTLLIIAIIGLTACQAHADTSPLPPDVIAADTVAVIRADSAHFTPDKLQAAMKTMLEDEATEVDEPLKKFNELYTKATDAGVDAITMVIGAPKKDDPDNRRGTGVLYLTLKDGADVKAVEALFTEKLMEHNEKREVVWDQIDNYLAMHLKKQEFPVRPDAAREAIFTEAMKTVANSAIQVVFVPDEAGRDMLRKSAETGDEKTDIRPKLAKARWMSLAMDLGSSPSIMVASAMATEDDAKATLDVIKNDMEMIKTQISKPGPMILVAPMIRKVIDGLKIEQTSTRVSVSINADSLKLIAEFVANTGMLEGR